MSPPLSFPKWLLVTFPEQTVSKPRGSCGSSQTGHAICLHATQCNKDVTAKTTLTCCCHDRLVFCRKAKCNNDFSAVHSKMHATLRFVTKRLPCAERQWGLHCSHSQAHQGAVDWVCLRWASQHLQTASRYAGQPANPDLERQKGTAHD